eukprot:CAMPEP_0201544138 /NCGR_PEP_ID=MMETSP0173_2-20130828/647_1 /ASSEMBLY_ACC=CAM_ASM_000268 /TAXON_ID=218659 /ORGANISM="Vexillifera sp., Strain DIVA3 564/2" /LENGTH=543 /DNA_ID=CAMNT_0047952157 /DNA_START=27 /DNA_END=1658 /DNA_ORIENTATION=-
MSSSAASSSSAVAASSSSVVTTVPTNDDDFELIQHKLNKDDAAVEHVTVFNDQAEVTRTISVELEKEGLHEIELAGLSSVVVPRSTRVSALKGKAKIIEVSYEKRFIEVVNDSDELGQAKERLEQIQLDLKDIALEKNRINKQLEFLKQYADKFCQVNVGDLTTTLTDQGIDAFSAFLESYEKRLQDGGERLLELDERNRALIKEKKDLTQLVTSWKPIDTSETNVIAVKVQVDRPKTLGLRIIYLVQSACWEPTYDVRATSDQPDIIQLVYYGKIKQSTGEHWDNCLFTLSTAQPSIEGKVPKLETFNLGWRTGDIYAPSASSSATSKHRGGTITANFDIPSKTSIRSDNKPHKVGVTMVELVPDLEHYAVPLKAAHAYLKATCKNPTTDVPFIHGNVNVFYDNTFVASTTIDDVNPNEEFFVYLGVDTQVKVVYKSGEAFSDREKKVFSSNINTKHFASTITVKNHKDKDLKITVDDQVPMSTDSKITVKMIEPSDPDTFKINDDTKKITWKLVIPPNHEEKLKLEYVVGWPTGREILGLF